MNFSHLCSCFRAHVSGLALITLSVSACGGSGAAKATETPDPAELLGDEPEGAAAAPSSAEVQQAIEAINAEDFASAKTLLEQALAKNPKDAQAAFYLGVSLGNLGDAEGAVRYLRQALTLEPNFTDASLNLSAFLLDGGDAEGALAAAEHGLKSAPQDLGLLQNKAMSLLATGAPAEAAETFALALEQQAENHEMRFLRAQALASAGEQEAALAELRKLSSVEQLEVLASAADLLGRLKAFDECADFLTKAIAIKAAAELYVRRGLCQHGKKDEDAAQADFLRAAELDPRSAQAQFYLGHNLKSRGDKQGAKKAFSKAIELAGESKLGAAAKKALASL